MGTAAVEDEMCSASQRLMEELGIRLLVDDFGSGLSNYRRLCEAWYDTIELDVELVRGIAASLRLQTLLRLGVDAVQGYLIAPPLRWRELGPFLEGSPWLEHWATLRSFEEVVLLYVQELRRWGLDVMRLSLAFLPNQEEVDCTQSIWYAHHPGEVEGKRMQRDFLLTPQHLQSVLHHIATAEPLYRLPLAKEATTGFAFLDELGQSGGSDYLGLRLSSRGVSTPVLSVCLQGAQRFAPEQIERVETLSGLLSLLFHAFESERASRLALLDALTQLPNWEPHAGASLDLDWLLQQADDCLYTAKGQGRDRVVAAVLSGSDGERQRRELS